MGILILHLFAYLREFEPKTDHRIQLAIRILNSGKWMKFQLLNTQLACTCICRCTLHPQLREKQDEQV